MLEAVQGFKDLTDLLSGEKRVTCSAIKPLIEVIHDKMVIPKDDDTDLTIEIKQRIKNDYQWLQTKKSLSVFVANNQIVTFKHVPSEDNPADLATRGKSPRELSSSIWWNGPHWLKESEEQWPNSKTPEVDNLLEFDNKVRGNKILFEAKL